MRCGIPSSSRARSAGAASGARAGSGSMTTMARSATASARALSSSIHNTAAAPSETRHMSSRRSGAASRACVWATGRKRSTAAGVPRRCRSRCSRRRTRPPPAPTTSRPGAPSAARARRGALLGHHQGGAHQLDEEGEQREQHELEASRRDVIFCLARAACSDLGPVSSSAAFAPRSRRTEALLTMTPDLCGAMIRSAASCWSRNWSDCDVWSRLFDRLSSTKMSISFCVIFSLTSGRLRRTR